MKSSKSSKGYSNEEPNNPFAIPYFESPVKIISSPSSNIDNNSAPKEKNISTFSDKEELKSSIIWQKYNFVSLIYKGCFCTVYLASYNDKYYAIKKCDKKSFDREILIEEKCRGCERICKFSEVIFPFIITEYYIGGNLLNYIINGKFSESKAKFYISNIILGIETLHNYNIIYRDLKAENILIDKDGYPILSDFGISKLKVKEKKSKKICGTLEYMSPEMIKCNGYDKNIDWWSLGILLYELVLGKTPFENKYKEDLKKLITTKVINIPPYLSKELVDLLNKLFAKNPEKRIGFKSGGSEIKLHPWFKDVDWKLLSEKKIVAPFIPELNLQSLMNQ